MKKQTILLLFLSLLLLFSNIYSDDKELFMGVDLGSNTVRPNVMVLMDSSGSMNSIIYYPQLGIDKELGGGDDGFNPNINYVRWVEARPNYLNTTRFYGRWTNNSGIDPTRAYQANSWIGIYGKVGEDTLKVLGRTGANSDFPEAGQWVIDNYGTAYAKVQSVIDDPTEVNTWYKYIILDPSTREGTFSIGTGETDNCLRFFEYDFAALGSDAYDFRAVRLYGTLDRGNPVRYPYNYIDWIFLHATDAHRIAISHFSLYGTFDIGFTPPEMEPNDATNEIWRDANPEWVEWWFSDCYAPGQLDRKKFRYTRMQVAREVMCKVAWTYRDTAKLGLTKFSAPSYGGDIIEHLNDMSDENSFVAYRNNVWDIEGDSWTPLAEALADIWKYYKPGATDSYWPMDIDMQNNRNMPSPNPVGPIDWWCQKNYVVIITDGESTNDRFGAADGNDRFANSIFTDSDYPVKRVSTEWDEWEDGWGDTDGNEAYSGIPSDYDPDTATYCPNNSCWYQSTGSDYLDDVAFFLAHQDLFPDRGPDGTIATGWGDDPETGWPGDQNINTYTIGFTIDNDMLQETAINGLGEYYTATSYEDLLEAFKKIITSILIRDFAFSAITAPKKTTTVSEEVNLSYVGYFIPSASKSVWEGHLQAKKLEEFWGFDTDGNGLIEFSEMNFDTKEDCELNNVGEVCQRILSLSDSNSWDAALKITKRKDDRAIFYYDVSENAVKSFTGIDATNVSKQLLFGAGTTEDDVNKIKTTISKKYFADIFHSDIAYVGAPLAGKKYLKNINPPDFIDLRFEDYFTLKKDRLPMIFVGTNDGVLHMIDGKPDNGGKEEWGFIPDEVLPSLKKIVINSEHTYTVDGRIQQNDIFYRPATGDPEWKTILTFGLRSGGKAFYTLDVSDVTPEPKLLWKFMDSSYSGDSWSKPIIRQIKIIDPDDSTKTINRWVVFLTGGFAFNDEDKNDKKGKAVFVVDASTGDLIWMIGYKDDGETDNVSTDYIETLTVGGVNNKHYTKIDEFNFSIPSSLTVIDKNNDGIADTMYFGNRGGHLFKVDIGNIDQEEWRTYLLYKQVDTALTEIHIGVITEIDDSDPKLPILKLGNTKLDTDYIGYNIMGINVAEDYAFGNAVNIDSFYVTVQQTSENPFKVGQTVTIKAYDPIYLNPAVSYDPCFKLWVSFGTGDRDRPRSNPNSGKFVALRDTGEYNMELDTNIFDVTDGSTVNQIKVDGTDYEKTENNVSNYMNGFYYKFPDAGEKMFDPEPIVLPDDNFNPHIIFNTYRPPEENSTPQVNPCNGVSEGSMTLYDIVISQCGSPDLEVEIMASDERPAGGGMYGGEYILYLGDGKVGSVPPLNRISAKKLPYPGGVIFWKEKKR